MSAAIMYFLEIWCRNVQTEEDIWGDNGYDYFL